MPKARAAGWKEFFNEVVRPRLEIIVTIVLDSGAIAVALWCRGFTLRAYHFGVGGLDMPWHLRALEYVLDYGIVATAIAVVAFDFAKRIKNSWLALVRDEKST